MDSVTFGQNQAPNGSFESNALGWSVLPLGGTIGVMSPISRVSDWAYEGLYSGYTALQGTKSDRVGFAFQTASSQGTYALKVAPGVAYSLSARLKVYFEGQTGGSGFVLITFKNDAGEPVGMTEVPVAVPFLNYTSFTVKAEGFVAPEGATYCTATFHVLAVGGGWILPGSKAWIDDLYFAPGMQLPGYTFPTGINLNPNPSFELQTGGFWQTGNTATNTYATDWAWAGTRSLKSVIHTAGATVVFQGNQFPDFAPIDTTKRYSASGVAFATTEGISARLRVYLFDEVSGTSIWNYWSDYFPITPHIPLMIRLQNMFGGPATATRALTRMEFVKTDGTPFAVGDTMYSDAFQYNEGLAADYYVDGDQGDEYFWAGAPHASRSYRIAVAEQGPTGQGGVMTVGARVFLSDRYNTKGPEVTDFVLSGSVDTDIDRDGPKTTVRLEVDDPEIIPSFSWLSVYYDLDKEVEGYSTRQIGLFRVEKPSEVFDGDSVTVQYSGFDSSIVLTDASSEDTVFFVGGTKYIDAVNSICNLLGVSCSFVDDPRTIPASGLSWKPGTSYLKIINELLAGIGYYSAFADPTGVIRSFPIIPSLYSVEPIRRYTVGENSDLVGTMQFDPNDESVFNHVLVFRDDPAKGAPLVANRYFDDPASPIAISRIGRKSKIYTFQEAADQGAIDAQADRLIDDRTMYVSGKLEILPDPDLGFHAVVDVDLSAMSHVPGSQDHSGRYYINNLSYPLGIAEATMKLGIRRVERTDV